MTRFGAYGFVFAGLEDSAEWLVESPGDWPVVAVRQQTTRPSTSTWIGADRAEVVLLGGRSATVTRQPSSVTFMSPEPLPLRELVHPFLAAPASILAHWEGAEPLHAGAFVAADRAWLLVAERRGGKSSTLAALAERGCTILTDDLAVVRGGRVYAGPRVLDLRDPRPDTADLGVVGSRRRWRRALDAAPPSVRLGGAFILMWGPGEEVQTLTVTERLWALSAARAVRLLGTGTRERLALVAAPAWRVSRRRSHDSVDTAVDLILDATTRQ